MEIKTSRIVVPAILFVIFSQSLPGVTAQAAVLPTAFDHRNIDSHSFIGPIRNQGACGSCYSFGTLAAAEGAWNRTHHLSDDQTIDLSEAFMVWSLDPLYENIAGCNGGNLIDPPTAMLDYGMPLEDDFPYTATDPGQNLHWDAPRYTLTDWYPIPVNDIETTRRVLYAIGPVAGAVIGEPATWYPYTEGIFEDNYRIPTAANLNSLNHAISLVGWNDTPGDGGMGYWILRNSWSEEWGDDGYMHIRYTAALSNSMGVYLIAAPWSGESITLVNEDTRNAVAWSAGGTINAHGVDLWGGAASKATNRGSIFAEAVSANELATARGIYLWGGPQGSVVNEGTISGFAGSQNNQAIAYGVCLQGGLVDNRNLLTAEAESDADLALAYGVWAANGGNGLEIRNSGEMRARAAAASMSCAYGIWAENRAQTRVVNSGAIIAQAEDTAVGIRFNHGPASLENSGTILAEATSLNPLGLYSGGIGVVTIGQTSIVNRGVISGNWASVFGSSDSSVSLELAAGSNLIGPVALNGDDDLLLLTGSGSEDESFSGVESLIMQGNDWSLAGDSSFASINIVQGRLGVDGELAGATTVMDNGILGGNGTLNGNVASSGAVAPGNSVGHLTIAGDFNQDAGGTLVIETGNGSSDLLTVTGTADLAGTLLVLPDGYAGGGSYTFLEAATLAGAFDLVRSVAVLDVAMRSNAPGNLALDISRNSYTSLASPHNSSLAGNLDSLRPTADGDLGDLLDRLDFAESRSELNTDLAAMTPRIHGLASAVVLGDSQARLDDLRRHVDRIDQAPGPDEEPESLNSLWIDALGHYTRYDADEEYFSARKNLYGLIFGMERLTRSGLTMGLAAAATKSSYESRDTDDEGENRSLQGYLYGSWRNRNQPGGLRIAAAVGAGAAALSADRTIDFAARTTHGEHDGQIYSATLQGRYDWTPAGWIIGPTLGVSYVHLREEGFLESGADSVDLQIQSRTNDSLQGLLGGRIAHPLTSAGLALEPELRVEWRHEFDDDNADLQAKLAGGGAYFTTPGRDPASDSLLLGAALKTRLSASIFGALGYDCELPSSGDAIDHALSLQLILKF